MSDFNIKEFTDACAKQFCLECGNPVSYQGRGRPRVFCSDRCRWAYDKRKRRKELREERLHEDSRIKDDTGLGLKAGGIQSQEETETWR